MNRTIIIGTVALLTALSPQTLWAQIYKDRHAPIEERVEDLLSRMTLEEKVLQLHQRTIGKNKNSNNIGEKIKDIPA